MTKAQGEIETSTFVNTEGGKKFSTKIITIERAAKTRSTPSTPIVKSDDALKPVLKRIGESPNEAENRVMLNLIRMDSEQLEDETNFAVKITYVRNSIVLWQQKLSYHYSEQFDCN